MTTVQWDDPAETMAALNEAAKVYCDVECDIARGLWVRASIAARAAEIAWAIAEAWSAPAITEAEYHAVLADTETRPVAYISNQASVTVWRTPTGEIVARCVRVGNVVRFTR